MSDFGLTAPSFSNAFKRDGKEESLKRYIKEVSVQPVINENKYTTFNEEDYQLDEKEKVKVAEEKFFSVQNYYNYIYAEQLNEEIYRFVAETQK